MSETRTGATSASTPVPRGGEVDDQIRIDTRTPSAGRVVIAVGGEVDMLTSPQLRATVLEFVGGAAGTELVVLDLDQVSFLGTSGLAALIEVREAAHTAGVELRLACSARRVLRPLAIAGLVALFDIHDTVDEALRDT
jgi:anti-sigma B factor antagonist